MSIKDIANHFLLVAVGPSRRPASTDAADTSTQQMLCAVRTKSAVGRCPGLGFTSIDNDSGGLTIFKS
jgi:hypothetical protein